MSHNEVIWQTGGELWGVQGCGPWGFKGVAMGVWTTEHFSSECQGDVAVMPADARTLAPSNRKNRDIAEKN